MATTVDTRQRAIAAAVKLGAEFRVLGLEVTADLPGGTSILPALLERVPLEELLAFLDDGATERAVSFLAKIGGRVELLNDVKSSEAMIRDLDALPHGLLGVDIETAAGELPPPIRINKDGSLAAVRKRRDDPAPAAIDPNRAEIASLQLSGDGRTAFLCTGDAKTNLLRRRASWFSRQHLVAHNAAFETAFLQHAGLVFNQPIECTMLMSQLVYGPSARSLAAATERVLGVGPPKAFATSYWDAARLSDGQAAYAGLDAILAWALGSYLLPRVLRGRYRVSYELMRDALPAVSGMGNRGLGFDQAEHARQIAQWQAEQEALCVKYIALTGNPPPRTPAEIGALIEKVIGK